MNNLEIFELRARVEVQLTKIVTSHGQTALAVNDVFGLRQFLGWHVLRFQKDVDPRKVPQALARFLLEIGGVDASADKGAVKERLIAAKLMRTDSPISAITLRRRIALLAHIFTPDQMALGHHPEVRKALRAVELAQRRARAPESKSGCDLSNEQRGMLLATCDKSMTGTRDRALLAAWFATDMSMTQLLRLDRRALLEAIRRSADALACTEAIHAVKAWIDRANLPEGPVFRRVWAVGRVGAPMGARAVDRMVLVRLKSLK